MEERKKILELLNEHDRRLHLRQKQAAQQGISVDPSILNEIEDIKVQMKALQVKYGEVVIMQVRILAFELLSANKQQKKLSSVIASLKRQIASLKKNISLLSLNASDDSDKIEYFNRTIAELKHAYDESLATRRESRRLLKQAEKDFIEALTDMTEWMEFVTPKK